MSEHRHENETSRQPVAVVETSSRHRGLSRLRLAVVVFANGFFGIGLLAALALGLRLPMVFPSLGPTAFWLFFSPESRTACPRNTLFGHAVGILCGYGALWLTGLQDAPSAIIEGVSLARVFAAALSLALTGALMILFDAVHSPAGATTLIVSLGIITHPARLVIIELAVAAIVAQACLVNRLRGIPYPLWAPGSDFGGNSAVHIKP
ncbi:MAG: HPP family protein [Candidatus Omnitrophica bacterium]|nr:HPP family protein [Candidatus Omnitrophota bacterium]